MTRIAPAAAVLISISHFEHSDTGEGIVFHLLTVRLLRSTRISSSIVLEILLFSDSDYTSNCAPLQHRQSQSTKSCNRIMLPRFSSDHGDNYHQSFRGLNLYSQSNLGEIHHDRVVGWHNPNIPFSP